MCVEFVRASRKESCEETSTCETRRSVWRTGDFVGNNLKVAADSIGL